MSLFKQIKNKVASAIVGKTKCQKFFETLDLFALRGINIGGGKNPQISGEKVAMVYIKDKLHSLPEVIIFDVGANIGQSCIAEKEVFGDKAKVYSFEPSRKTFQALQRNVKGLIGVQSFNFGFGEANTKLVLFSNADESGLASVYQRKLDHFNIQMSKKEEVEIRTLDTFCQKNSIDRIHFLKLDVEGNEMKVLEGAKKMLSNGAIDYIQFEFGGCNIDSRTYFQDYYYFLKGNYTIYRIVRDGLFEIKQYKEMYEAFMTTNYLAEKK